MHTLESTGGAGTNWSAYDVPEVWTLIGDYGVDPQWTHIAGWRKASELTTLHLSHITAYRDQLAQAWPPEMNEASRVYLAKLDELIASVTSTYEAAVANHDTMSSATKAIMAAKYQLKPIHDRWEANSAVMADYEQRVAATQSGTPAPMPGPPPLPPDWRDDLNRQARTLMSGLSSELALAAVSIVIPPGYTAPTIDYRETSTMTNGTTLVRPSVPPIKPNEAPVRPPAAVSPPPAESIGLGFPGGRVQPPGSIGSPVTPTPQPITVAPEVIGPVVIAPGSSPGSTTSPVKVVSSKPEATTRTGLGGVTTQRPLPPGGVIGNLATPRTIPHVRPAAAQRINPVGGVIGRPSQLVSANTQLRASNLLPGGRHPGEGPRPIERSSQWDRDNPWAIDEGVTPVVQPAGGPTRHVTGPAIGLDC